MKEPGTPDFFPAQPQPEVNLKRMPQMNEKNGISLDYKNEFSLTLLCVSAGLKFFRESYEAGDELFRARTYEERFPQEQYADEVVNDSNRELVARIDAAVAEYNQLFDQAGEADEAGLQALADKAHYIVGLVNGTIEEEA